MGIGRVKFPYKSVPESTSSKKKRRRNGKADPSETSTSDHSDDPQNFEARVPAKSIKRFQASEAGRSHPPPSFPSPFSTQANLAAEKNLEILVKNDDQSSAFSSLAGALGNLSTDLSNVGSNSEPALSTRSLAPSAMPQLSSPLSSPAGSLLHNHTSAEDQLEDINGSLHTGSQHSTAVKVQSNIPEWRRQSPPKLDAFKSNKRLRDDEYTRRRIVQISTIANQKTHEGWRGHPSVILGTWGDLVAVCASSTWSSCGGRNDKFGQVDGIQERELRLRFFPLLKYVNKVDYDKYGMLNFEGSKNIFQAKSWLDIRACRFVRKSQLERYVEKDTTDKEAFLTEASLNEVEDFWGNLTRERTFADIKASGDYPWNPRDLATIFRYLEAKKTGLLPDEGWVI